MLEEHEITSVVNISRARAPSTADADYASRRAAVDFGIPVCPATLRQECGVSILTRVIADQQSTTRCAVYGDVTEEVYE